MAVSRRYLREFTLRIMNLCYLLSAPLYRRKHRQTSSVDGDIHRSSEAYWQWQFNSSAVYFEKFWDLKTQLAGKRVLDIGCGLGGRTSYLATLGAREVVGIDINGAEIEQARQLAARAMSAEARTKLRFEKVQEGVVPDLEPFDVAILVDSLEHVRDPVAMLDIAYSHLRPGGICYFGTVGWYHYNAAHLISILPLPFITVFFPDATIIDAVRRTLHAPWYVPTMWDTQPPAARWDGVTDLRDRPGEYLNKVTIRKIQKAMRDSQFNGGALRVAGFSRSSAPWMKWLNILASVPVIQEAYHSGCFGRLVKS
jgi:2-polyprenyl-3-methyl-5-hydroxy-6-metoxy-1,4-benzoquinol methylase